MAKKTKLTPRSKAPTQFEQSLLLELANIRDALDLIADHLAPREHPEPKEPDAEGPGHTGL